MEREEDIPDFKEFKKVLVYLEANRREIERGKVITPDEISRELSISVNRVNYALSFASFVQSYVPPIKLEGGKISVSGTPAALLYRKPD